MPAMRRVARRTSRRTSRRVNRRQDAMYGAAEPADAPEAEYAAEPAPAAEAPDRLEQLKQLGGLHEQGILTDEEFAAEKAKILGNS
jgi:hypothetical protein